MNKTFKIEDVGKRTQKEITKMKKKEFVEMLKSLLETKKEMFEYYKEKGDERKTNVYAGNIDSLQDVIVMLEDKKYYEKLKSDLLKDGE